MNTRFQWLSPAIPEEEHSQVERLVVEALQVADFLEHERRSLLVRFIPDSPVCSSLVATIEEERTGKLLGVVETPRNDAQIKLTSAAAATSNDLP
ncbi:hypothetical protein GJ698_01205 [Pseudoduganella sp. FT26W]|uniref:Uncharacterized protein n=1 Tax=Duganella aquatilis TaxID=2666082 RepID=A0A844CPS4_9BURK|nr:hypothetical protein [Duganella aquatilis]MRW82707.1 hypothetical protein [Duganella aquatilis]